MHLMSLLEKLKLPHLAVPLESLCEHAAQGELGYPELLTQALASEWQGRHRKGVEARLRQARLPWGKTREQFDCNCQPSIDRQVMRELAGLVVGERTEHVILLGVGTTPLAVALAVKAVEAGHRVLFMTLDTVLSRLKRAAQENRLERQLSLLAYPKVLICAESGYLPMPREDASVFFRLVVRRYERARLILTSNKRFIDWGELVGDQVLATAILDRLLHHCTTLNSKGESYRLKEKRKAG